MEPIIVESPNYGELKIQEFYDTDENRSGIEVYYDNGEYITTVWGETIPDVDDPDYDEIMEDLLRIIDDEIELDYTMDKILD